MNQVVLVTGASSGFGRMIANQLAGAGHTVYCSMRGLLGKNAHQVAEVGAGSSGDENAFQLSQAVASDTWQTFA